MIYPLLDPLVSYYVNLHIILYASVKIGFLFQFFNFLKKDIPFLKNFYMMFLPPGTS